MFPELRPELLRGRRGGGSQVLVSEAGREGEAGVHLEGVSLVHRTASQVRMSPWGSCARSGGWPREQGL